jgi:hypothetical protein
MLNNAFFKRIIPFFLTFAFGLFIASFFVSVLPTFQFKKNHNRCGKRSEVRKLRYENERLRLENQRLQQRTEANERIMLLKEAVPPPPPIPPRIVEMPLDEAPRVR